MKRLYTFTIPFKTSKDIQIEKVIDGKNVTVVEKEEITEQREYFIRKPSRTDHDDAEFFYDKIFSYNIRQGIVTKSEIIKRFANDDVVIKQVYDNYVAKENELQRVVLQEKTEENIEKEKRVQRELLEIMMEIQNFETNKSSVFDRTAENRAASKTVFWWILNLAYRVDKEKEYALFDGSTYEEKAAQYDKLFENPEPHMTSVMQRFLYFVPAWYYGQLNTEQDFRKAETMLTNEIRKIDEATAKDSAQIAPE